MVLKNKQRLAILLRGFVGDSDYMITTSANIAKKSGLTVREVGHIFRDWNGDGGIYVFFIKNPHRIYFACPQRLYIITTHPDKFQKWMMFQEKEKTITAGNSHISRRGMIPKLKV